MTNELKTMLVEELSEQEMELVSGGQTQEGLVNVVVGDVTVLEDVRVAVAANVALLSRGAQNTVATTQRAIQPQPIA